MSDTRVPLATIILRGIVAVIRAFKCKCKSKCMDSECIQGDQEVDKQDIMDYVQELETIFEDTTKKFSEHDNSEKKDHPL